MKKNYQSPQIEIADLEYLQLLSMSNVGVKPNDPMAPTVSRDDWKSVWD